MKIGEFLCSHFNIEDIKRVHIFSVLCFIISRMVKMQLKHTKKICAVYGEGAVTDWTCQKWFAEVLGTMDSLAKWFFAMGLS